MSPLTPQQIRSGVDAANIPALIMTIYQFTGSATWLGGRFRPTRARGLDDNDSGGLDAATQELVRATAVDVFLRLQAGEQPAITAIDADEMAHAMGFYMGEEVAPEYGRMLATEYERRAASQPQPPDGPTVEGFRVAIIGGGVGGIAAARHCQELGIDFVLFEESEAAGGVWWKNSYPGAGVDTPSHLYSLSFAKHDWSTHYALRDEIQAYLSSTLGRMRDSGADVRFASRVVRAEWSEHESLWQLSVDAGGTESTMSVNAVISSVGGLNRPSVPQVPGADRFEGIQFHSSRWPEHLDVAGKRVVIVGTGASAMQIAPEIAPSVSQLTIVQRSPQWVAPFGKFRLPIPDDLRRLLVAFPLYYGWYWLRLFWQFGDNVLQSLRKEPDWPHPERSVSRRNDGHREFFTSYIRERLGDRLDLLPDVVPTYPPFGKRILLDNGWYDTLRMPNVELVAGDVVSVDEAGVLTDRGKREADIVIWATGFLASEFVGSVEVIGRGGESLRTAWDGLDSRSYLGVAVPGFPNFFTLGGPNSFPGSGSIMFWLELQADYVCSILSSMAHEGIGSVEVREDVHAAYNDLIDAEHAAMIWTHPGMRTYYRGPSGRVVFVSPFRNVDFWERLQSAGLDDYVLDHSPITSTAPSPAGGPASGR